MLRSKMRRVPPVIFALAATMLLAQKVWREYPAFEYNDFPIPSDYQERTEFTFARLMYPNAAFGGRGGRGVCTPLGGRARGAGGAARLCGPVFFPGAIRR